MDVPSAPPTPPSCSDCATQTQPAAGGQPTQSASRMWRSSNGSMRLDTPNTSIISLPASQQTILLDHLKKEAMVIPTPPASSGSPQPSEPHMPGAATPAPPLQVQDLGKSTIEGHEVEGKRFTFTPPPAPQPAATASAPKMPQPPGAPAMVAGMIPGMKPGAMPGTPAPPKSPQAPKPQLPKLSLPTVTEVWTSVKLKTPVLTKVSSPAGEQTTYCKPTSTDEPHPSLFQIPAGYKLKKPQ